MYATLAGRTLLSQYFDSMGFSPVQLGVLIAATPVILLFASPLWFKIGSGITNSRAFKIMVLASTFLVWPVFMLEGFFPKLIALVVFALFMAAAVPVGEATIITALQLRGLSFDRVRLWGTIGYASAALFLGIILRFGFVYLFGVYSGFFFLAYLTQKKINAQVPAGGGKIRETTNEGEFPVFLMMLMGILLGVSVSAFNSSFFPVLTRELGFDVSSAGVGYSVMAFSEIPFLLFADRIVKRFGNLRVLTIGMFLTGLRVFLASIAPSMSVMLTIQSMHGVNFIVMYYAVFNYIYFKLPRQDLVRAQMLFWMVIHGLSYFIGSVLGGVIVEGTGTISAFRIVGTFGMVVSALPVLLVMVRRFRTV